MNSCQRVFGNVAWLFVVADHLSRDAQDSAGGTVIQSERPQQIPPRSSGARGEALQKNREAAERRAAKTVNGLAMVAHHNKVGPLASEQPEKFELRDVGVLKLVDQNVPVARAQRLNQRVVRAEMLDGIHDLRAERKQLAFAKEKIAGSVGTRNFLNFGDFFVADAPFPLILHRAADALKIFRYLRGIALVVVWRDQFILAAREKLHEVAQKLSGLGQAPVVLQLQKRQIAPEQYPVVDFVDGLEVRVEFMQQGIAERMKCAQRDRHGALRFRFPAAAGRRNYAVFHFRSGLVCERQAQDFLAREFRLGIEQIADALGDDASFPCARAGHYHERSFAMMHGGALLGIKLNSRCRGPGKFKKVSHLESSQPTTVAHERCGRINRNLYNKAVI